MDIDLFEKTFNASKGFYPSLSQFINDVRDATPKDKKFNRKDAIEWYNAQQIVQVFGAPPIVEALKKKKGFYPKIISFFPFERLYVDTGSISIYKYTRKQEKSMEKTKKIIEPSKVEKEEKEDVVKDVVKDEGDWLIKEGQYNNRGKVTPFLIFKKGKLQYRFEKYLQDIESAKKWLDDNIKIPFSKANDKNAFLQDKKAKK